MKDVQLGNGGPPGSRLATAVRGAESWRAVIRVLQSCRPSLLSHPFFQARSALLGLLADVTHAFLPSDCRVCGAAMVDSGTLRVCGLCVEQVAAPSDDILCSRCGDAMGMESARFAASMGVTQCTMCRMAPPQFERAVSIANYDRQMRLLLHQLKFDGVQPVAEQILGQRLAVAITKLRAQAGNDLLVAPVPLFAARERERGFNQARLLAESAIKTLRRTQPQWKLRLEAHLLVRVRDTRVLHPLAPHQRRAALNGAFRVYDKALVAGREVLLIDDIMTTGATARECSRVLLRAGAARVWVATAAKAQPESTVSAFRTPVDVAMWTAPDNGLGTTLRTARAAPAQRLMKPEPERRRGF